MICKQGGFVIQRHNELRVLDIEHGTLTSLIFTTTGRMSDFDKKKNMIVLESSIKTAIMNTIVIITTVVIAVVVSFI